VTFGVLIVMAVGAFNNRMRERFGDGIRNMNPDNAPPPPRLELVASGTGAPPESFADAEPLLNAKMGPRENAAAWMHFRPESDFNSRRPPSAAFEAKSLDGKVEYRTRSYRKGTDLLMVVDHDYATVANIVLVTANVRLVGLPASNVPTQWRLPKLPPPLRRLPKADPTQPAQVGDAKVFAVRLTRPDQTSFIALVAEGMSPRQSIHLDRVLESTFGDLRGKVSLGVTGHRPTGTRILATFGLPDAERITELKVNLLNRELEQYQGKIRIDSLVLKEFEGFPVLAATKVQRLKVGPVEIETEVNPYPVGAPASGTVRLPIRNPEGWFMRMDFDREQIEARGVSMLDVMEPQKMVRTIDYGTIGPLDVEMTIFRFTRTQGVETVIPVVKNEEVASKLGFRPIQMTRPQGS